MTDKKMFHLPEHLRRGLSAVVKRANAQYGECSWLGIGRPADDDGWDIIRIEFPEQENTKGTSDMAQSSIAAVMMDLEDGEKILWWGHSHGTMNTFFSGTDESTWADWVEPNPDVFLATVHNVKGETYARVHYHGYEFSSTDNPFTSDQDPDVEGMVTDALAAMSKPKTVATTLGTGGWHTGQGSLYGKSGWKATKDKEIPSCSECLSEELICAACAHVQGEKEYTPYTGLVLSADDLNDEAEEEEVKI